MQWAGISDHPKPDKTWVDRCRYHGEERKIYLMNWDREGGYDKESRLPSDKPIAQEKVNDDTNTNDNKNNELITPPTATFTDVQKIIESFLGIMPTGEAGIKAITEIVNMGATKEDIEEGYKWLKKNTDKPIRYYSSLVGPTKTSMAIRLQGGVGTKDETMQEMLDRIKKDGFPDEPIPM